MLFFAPDGSCSGKHRKVMPTAMERLVWGFGDGSTMPVLDTPLGRIGAVICWENYMPLLRMAMYGKGVGVCACCSFVVLFLGVQDEHEVVCRCGQRHIRAPEGAAQQG